MKISVVPKDVKGSQASIPIIIPSHSWYPDGSEKHLKEELKSNELEQLHTTAPKMAF